MFDTLMGKYRNIVVSIALFLLLDASVLTLNFYISFEIADDAVGVNLSGRQRMLSQRMVKSLHDIQYSAGDEQARQRALDELDLTQRLFSSTLNAFDQGGEAIGADGSEVVLEAANSSAARLAIVEAKEIWQPYSTLINAVLNADGELALNQALMPALAYARANNLALLKLMNNLTVELEHVATSKATRLRWIQTVGITLAIINFLIILVHFLGQLRESDKQIESARKETTEILETVGEGLFLLDKERIISSQYSRALETMFVRKELGGLSLEALLESMVSDKDLRTAQRFIALLFREDIKSNLIGDLNPLKEIEVNISDNQGHYLTKYFSFTFERVYDDGKIKDILVTVVDVSEKVRLERELALSKEQNERQIEVLTSILHANPDLLKLYLKQVEEAADDVNTILREPSKGHVALKRKLDQIFVAIHRIKGEASALNLESFEELTHEFELNIKDVHGKDNITGDDFLPLVVRLEKLVKHTESVQVLTAKLGAFSSGAKAPARSESISSDWHHLEDLLNKSSLRCGKQVQLFTSGLSEVPMSKELSGLLSDFAIQGIRNAVAHGIETPSEREQLNKDIEGKIELRLSQSSKGELEFVVKDDGGGIDIDRIREKAAELGIASETELESWSAKRLTSLIFEPGFSTAAEHTMDAGTGAGMDLLRQRVNAMRGRIRIASRSGHGTKISVFLPAPAAVSEAA
ncbi:ATP-binding protein [Agaribacterium haliotis]|uniref:ATP-binding protein n=1 Tax=Agaribacterium haliotis TaxID=2013869 RepID=UPI000BB5313B|nr:ATP-binding protein [Agaribacterium haliotis]